MIVGSLTKTPYEKIDASVDFNARLGDETVSSFAVTAITSGGQDVTSTLIATFPAPAQSGGVVTFRVIGGTANVTYFAVVKVVASDGQQYEGDVTLIIILQ